MSCKNTLYSCILALHAHKAPQPCEELQLFLESATGGSSLMHGTSEGMWWILGLDPLQTGSLAASAGPLPPSSVDQSPFTAFPTPLQTENAGWPPDA